MVVEAKMPVEKERENRRTSQGLQYVSPGRMEREFVENSHLALNAWPKKGSSQV